MAQDKGKQILNKLAAHFGERIHTLAIIKTQYSMQSPEYNQARGALDELKRTMEKLIKIIEET